MLLEIRLFATLRNYFPDKPDGVLSVTVPEGASINKVISELRMSAGEIKIIMVNGVQADFDDVLKDGDRVGLFPPVGGG